MKIKSNHNNQLITGLSIALLIVCILSSYFLNKSDEKPLKTDDSIILKPTDYRSSINYHHLISTSENCIYDKDSLKIFLIKHLGVSYLLYAYTGEIDGRRSSDKFFIHLKIKNNFYLINTDDSIINLDFAPSTPLKLQINKTTYFVFKKKLIHHNYKGELIKIGHLKEIESGRFIESEGVSESYGFISIEDNFIKTHSYQKLDRLIIQISKSNYQIIKAKRDEALNIGVLTTDKNDLFDAILIDSSGIEKKAKIRLKGDLTDHLSDEIKWSFRLVLDSDQTYKGQRKFSIQHPVTRNYLWEWLFQKTSREEGIVSLRYDFAHVELQLTSNNETESIPLGIMAIEEAFDKLLIENNGRKAGIIIAFDESILWEDRKLNLSLNLNAVSELSLEEAIKILPIKVYNQDRVLANSILRKQYAIAKSLLNDIRSSKIKISEAFDIDKLTTYTALANLFGATHAMHSHNIRVYYNPISGKLEPITFDAVPIRKLNKIIHYPFAEKDEEYLKILNTKLQYFSQASYCNNLIQSNKEEIARLSSLLGEEFNANINPTDLDYNSNFIKKQLYQSDQIISTLQINDLNQAILRLQNITQHSLQIVELIHIDGKKISTKSNLGSVLPFESKQIIIDLDPNYKNAFISKKQKKARFNKFNDIKKIELVYNVVGTNLKRINKPAAYVEGINTTEFIDQFKPNIEQFEFARINHIKKEIIFKRGWHSLTHTAIIPSNYILIVEEGFRLDFKNEASLISYSPIICRGSKNDSIHFYSTDKSGNGIYITNTTSTSSINYCNFSNLSNPSINNWQLSGAINFYESDVIIKNSKFDKNRSEDALNIVRSEFHIDSTIFNNIYSDAFDGDFTEGVISNSKFINCGNDAIDVSGSTITLENVYVENSRDKAISGGESSLISGRNIKIHECEIGIVSKDHSSINLENIVITDCNLGISVFQKKTEFGAAKITISNLHLANNDRNFLIEKESSLIIDGEQMPTVSYLVANKLYGNKYGKSSK